MSGKPAVVRVLCLIHYDKILLMLTMNRECSLKTLLNLTTLRYQNNVDGDVSRDFI